MSEIIKKVEQPPIWSFFCENEDEKQANGSIEEAIRNILQTDNNKSLIFRTENLVQKRLANSITSSQLRKLFDVVRKEDFNQMRIQLIYIAARQNNPVAQNFVQFVKTLINHIQEDEVKLKRFRLFMESIVSYHKYYSKK